MLRQVLVVSTPGFGPDGEGGFTFPVMRNLETLAKNYSFVHGAYDWAGSTNVYEEDDPRWEKLFGAPLCDGDAVTITEGHHQSRRGLVVGSANEEGEIKVRLGADEQLFSPKMLDKVHQDGLMAELRARKGTSEEVKMLKMIREEVVSTTWFKGFVRQVMSGVKMLCEKGHPVVMACIDGGPISKVEQLEMPHVKTLIESELRQKYVEGFQISLQTFPNYEAFEAECVRIQEQQTAAPSTGP